MRFDKPTNPNVEYLAAVQAVITICHRRVSRNALTLTGTGISSCATSSRPVQMMSDKYRAPAWGAVLLLDQMMKLCQSHLEAFAWASALPKGRW
jgi:hypothetical protein